MSLSPAAKTVKVEVSVCTRSLLKTLALTPGINPAALWTTYEISMKPSETNHWMYLYNYY